MNEQNLSILIEAIKTGKPFPEIGFNMNTPLANLDEKPWLVDRSGRNCRSVACIGGWASMLSRNQPWLHPKHWAVEAREWLEMTNHQAGRIFYPTAAIVSSITVDQAVKVLEYCAVTGEPDWSVVFA